MLLLHNQSFIADEDEELYSNLLPGKISFLEVKAVFNSFNVKLKITKLLSVKML